MCESCLAHNEVRSSSYDTMDKEKGHQEFLERLRLSQAAVWAVAEFLSAHDYIVTVPPTSYAEKYSERFKHKDGGDLWAVLAKNAFTETPINHYQRIEVKRLSAVFSGYNDYPFQELIVNSVDSHDRSNPIPVMYFLVSFDLSHAGIVKVKQTQDSWYVKEKNSSLTNARKDYYHCPLDLATWVVL